MALEMDDLFVARPKKFTVSELTRSIRDLLTGAFGRVQVEGEISSLRRQSSGHQYFTLKDDRSQIACVLFARNARNALRQPTLADGMQALVRGELTVYEVRGQYQIIVSEVQEAGAGLLAARFEALKKKLQGEGFFEPERKKSLPKFPQTVGIVTSPTGAAIRDMINVLHRRAPWMKIVIRPARVQGKGAAEEIAAAVREFNDSTRLKIPRPDILIIGRGGGSAEDLWEFNEEVLARAIFASEIPVVSAVGHEIDFTISDFVADVRAATPSAAAEIIAPDSAEWLRRLRQMEGFFQRKMANEIEQARSRLASFARSALVREPRRCLDAWQQQIDLAHESLLRNTRLQCERSRQQISSLTAILRQYRPDALVAMKRSEMEALAQRLRELVSHSLERRRQTLESRTSMLRVLAPEATLKRGFSITTDESGKLIRSAKAVKQRAQIRTRLSDGEVRSRVE